MEFAIFCTRINFLVFLLALSSPSIFIQSPMDFGPLNLLHTTNASSLDFGRIYFNTPSAVLRPQSPQEISHLLSFLSSSSSSKVTVAAKGAGHSINGQAQALNGIVIEMDALPPSIKIHKGGDGKGGDDDDDEISYVDVSAGVLWVELLKETLKVGLAPRSWTDYLYLTVGGTLSNGGISGQTFKYGPQISNVLQLDVVTGKGELVTCSPTKTPELYYSVLGGLGQFGIITSARILLQKAPQKVKWVRAFYDDFEKFIKDQELLVVSMADKVDYVEGFIVLNEEALLSSSIAFPANLSSFAQKLFPQGSTTCHPYYCMEFAVNDQADKQDLNLDQVVEDVLENLSFMPWMVHSVEIGYFDFLNRVRMEELYLREIGLWDVPHPWLNMFLPKPGVTKFRDLLLETLSSTAFEGPILIYPILRDKWDAKASAILPETGAGAGAGAGAAAEGQVVFIVGMLRSVNPSTCTEQCLEHLIRQNGKITEMATDPKMGIGAKLYLPHYTNQEQWREHFGGNWERLLARKSKYDPLNILAPGQSIFTRKSNNKSKGRTNRVTSQ